MTIAKPRRQQTTSHPAAGGRATPLLLEAFLPYRLNVLAATVSEALARIYRERFSFGIPEWRVMATLGQFGEITAREISTHAMMHKTKVSRAVAALEARLLIERRPNTSDKREAILRLLPEGERIYRCLVPHALAFSSDLDAALSSTERQALDAILLKLMQRAETLGVAPTLPGGDL